MRANATTSVERYLKGHTRRRGQAGALPAHVRAKRAKGRLYYYFSTGRKDENGRDVLLRLPDKNAPDFAEAVAAATLERWQSIRPRWTPNEVIIPEAKGDHLYFVRVKNAVKIGRARNVPVRLASMQTDNADPIDCLCVLTGRGHEEKEWHNLFVRQRIRGEWFTWTPLLAQAIDEARRGKKPWIIAQPPAESPS